MRANVCCSPSSWAAAGTSVWRIGKTQMNQGYDFNLYHSQASVRLQGQVLKDILSCFSFPRHTWHIQYIKRSLGTAAHMLLGCLGILRGCFFFPSVERTKILGRQEQAGKAAGVQSLLLSSQLRRLCLADYFSSWGRQFAWKNRFWGENTPSCSCQGYKVGKRFIRRSPAIFRKWELTISRQKRVWDLSISSVTLSCQKERCQRDVVTKPNVLEASVVTREGEMKGKRFNGSCVCTITLRTKLRLCILFHLELDCRVYFCRINEVKLQF